jgi:hypothetical protein
MMNLISSVFVATGHIVRSNGHDCVELVRPVALNLFNSVLKVLSSRYINPIQFFCHPHTPQLLFILGGKEVGGLLVIILQF